MAERVYRVGISGSGFGARSHLPALSAHPRFDVVAIASPSSAARIAEERKIAHHFRSCAEMVEGCELDAAIVASPPFAHRDDVLAALAAGKHVLCEKPFALSVAQAQEMAGALSRSQLAGGINHEFRFVPQLAALKELVANHHLDPLRNIEATLFRQMLHRGGTRERGWWFERACGGGIAGAMLSHMIDQASWLAGGAPEASAGYLRIANPRRRDERGEFESTVDDGAFALARYDGGVIARLSADTAVSVNSYTCAVHGEDRTAVASGSSITDLTLYSIDGEETNELDCKPSPYARFRSVDHHVPFLMELYDEFVKAIEGTPNALPTFDEALSTQRVLASIGYGTD